MASRNYTDEEIAQLKEDSTAHSHAGDRVYYGTHSGIPLQECMETNHSIPQREAPRLKFPAYTASPNMNIEQYFTLNIAATSIQDQKPKENPLEADKLNANSSVRIRPSVLTNIPTSNSTTIIQYSHDAWRIRIATKKGDPSTYIWAVSAIYNSQRKLHLYQHPTKKERPTKDGIDTDTLPREFIAAGWWLSTGRSPQRLDG